jgi:hypothetical protein
MTNINHILDNPKAYPDHVARSIDPMLLEEIEEGMEEARLPKLNSRMKAESI